MYLKCLEVVCDIFFSVDKAILLSSSPLHCLLECLSVFLDGTRALSNTSSSFQRAKI